MDFFEHQDKARKNTGKLFVLLALAVIGIIAAVNVLAFFTVNYLQLDDSKITVYQYWQLPYPLWLSAAVFLLMLGKSVWRYLQLRGGGHVLAEQLGAKQLSVNTKDTDEKRLYNVVEEMSIAAGLPMPMLYVLVGEMGINAFVAGITPNDAVMVVTEGALKTFNRDELQGVVAHEFSHIFHGDMAINLKLIGVLSGITVISQIGSALMRGSRRRSAGSSSKNSNGGAMIGLGLFVIGIVGVTSARLIKAAISRQREFLADASAVQYTRNPEGIASALFTIGASTGGSLLNTPYDEEISHLCFGEAAHLNFGLWFATHPPVNQRIDAIDKYYRVKRAQKQQSQRSVNAEKQGESEAKSAPGEFAFGSTVAVLASASMGATIGSIPPESIAAAQHWQENLPEAFKQARHDVAGAQAVLYALFMKENASVLKENAAGWNKRITPQVREAILQLWSQIALLDVGQRLPLVESCLATLQALPRGDAGVLIANLEQIAWADGDYSNHEFVLFALIRSRLQHKKPTGRMVKSYQTVIDQIATVVAALASLSDGGESIYARLMRSFNASSPGFGDAKPQSAKSLELAVSEIDKLSPLLKGSLMDVFKDCVTHNGRVALAEYEMIRAIGEMINCPVPIAVGEC